MFKKLFIFLFCSVFVTCFASKQEELFLKANDSYKSKNYKESFDLYKSIIKKGSTTFYNMGNCSFKLEKYLDAIIYWYRAKKGASFDTLNDIYHNISAAYDKLGISHDITFWTKMKAYINRFSLFVLQVLFLFFWFILFFLFIFLKKFRKFILLLPLFLSFGFSILLFVKHRAVNYPIAIVKSSSSLFAGPNEKYHQLGKLSIADKVVVQKKCKNWYKVNHDGVVGWALSENVEII